MTITDKQLEEWERHYKHLFESDDAVPLFLVREVRRLREENAELQKLVGETVAENATKDPWRGTMGWDMP